MDQLVDEHDALARAADEAAPRRPDRTTTPSPFNNPAVAVRSWYVAARSKEIRRGRAKSFDLLGRRIVLYRDATTAKVHALDARCPHLGADLGHGQVIGDNLRCAFHHWCFGPDGHCRAAPGLADVPRRRRARAYTTLERWGLVWLFNGPADAGPLFDLPSPPPDVPVRSLRLPPQHIDCHPHLVVGNGLDAAHLEALHGLDLTEPPRLTVHDPYRLSLDLRGRPRSAILQHLTGCRGRDFDATFTTVGGTLAWLEARAPLRFWVLFSGRTSVTGGCDTQTVLFLPRRGGGGGPPFPLDLLRAAAFLYAVLWDDHRILDGLKFSPGFTEADGPLEAFARSVNAMEVW